MESNHQPPLYESGALPIELRWPGISIVRQETPECQVWRSKHPGLQGLLVRRGPFPGLPGEGDGSDVWEGRTGHVLRPREVPCIKLWRGIA
jgi:hypothetical protein